MTFRVTRMNESLHTKLAAAYIRGQREKELALPDSLTAPPLGELSREKISRLVGLGRDAGITLHMFKKTSGLARVERVLGMLRGLRPERLLDIGSGRGAFLWPLLDAFPGLAVTSIDSDSFHVGRMQALARGGMNNFTMLEMNACCLAFGDQAFDIVTMLEVLEHIPDTGAVIRETVRVSRRFIIVSVPLHEDDNPGHIHRFTAAELEQCFLQAGAARVSIDYVPNHIIGLVRCYR